MIYFATPSSPATVTAMGAGLLGMIDTPYQGGKHVRGAHALGAQWCADNGAYSSRWEAAHWWAWLQAQTPHVDRCYFATAPDVVGDYRATEDAAQPWLQRIRALGYPVAYVAQNGMEYSTWDLWDDIDALFLGGIPECRYHGAQVSPRRTGSGAHLRFWCPSCGQPCREWKLGPGAAELAAVAGSLGKHVHMGRVNSRRRYDYARAIGCDSADGTYLATAPDKLLPKALGWVAGADQHSLF